MHLELSSARMAVILSRPQFVYTEDSQWGQFVKDMSIKKMKIFLDLKGKRRYNGKHVDIHSSPSDKLTWMKSFRRTKTMVFYTVFCLLCALQDNEHIGVLYVMSIPLTEGHSWYQKCNIKLNVVKHAFGMSDCFNIVQFFCLS